MKTDGELFCEFSELVSKYTVACKNLYLAPDTVDREPLREIQHDLRVEIMRRYNELLTNVSFLKMLYGADLERYND